MSQVRDISGYRRLDVLSFSDGAVQLDIETPDEHIGSVVVEVADLLDALGYEDTTEEIERLRAKALDRVIAESGVTFEESLGEDGLADWERELLGLDVEPERKWQDGDLVRLAESSTESFFPTRYAGTVGRVIGYDTSRPLPYRVEYGQGNDAQFSEDELEPVGEPRVGDRVKVTTDKDWLAELAGGLFKVTGLSAPYVHTDDDDGYPVAFLPGEIEVVL